MVEQGAVSVDSVHNFCPVPMTVSRGHPEIYTFADRDPRVRQQAVRHTTTTIRFAAEVGANVVVTHCGNVEMKPLTAQLLRLLSEGKGYTRRFERTMTKLREQREKRGPVQFGYLLESLERLLPVLRETGIRLALEVLPSWEAFPSELEFESIFERFRSRHLWYWHDIGHAKIRENLGFSNVERWLERLRPRLAGMHLHDVRSPGEDHLMPPNGDIDFSRYTRFLNSDMLRVLEPRSSATGNEIREGLRHFREAWESDNAGAEDVNEERIQ